MLKFIGVVVLLAGAFGVGYFVGQNPVGNLKHAVTDLSRNVFDTTLGVERNLRMRQGLVEAKSKLIQAKSEMLDRNFGHAAKALTAASRDLENAAMAGPESHKERITSLSRRVQDIERDLSSGKPKMRGRLDDLQLELDGLL